MRGRAALLILLTILSAPALHADELRVADGNVSLRSLEPGSIATLRGTWEVYPDQELSPAALRSRQRRSYRQVPPPYGRYSVTEGQRLGVGSVTYRLIIADVPSAPVMAVRIPFAHGGIRAWTNGRPVVAIGTGAMGSAPSVRVHRRDTVDRSRVASGVIVPLLPDTSGRVELVIHTSQTLFLGTDLSFSPVRVGTLDALLRARGYRVLMEGILVGALLLLGLYHILLRFGTQHETASLTVAAVMLLIALRLLLVEGEMVLSGTAWLSAARFTRLRSLTIFPLAAAYLMSVARLFPSETNHRAVRVINVLHGVALAGAMLVSPVTWMDLIYLWIPVLIAQVGVVIMTLMQARRASRQDPLTMLAGLGAMLVAILVEVVRLVLTLDGVPSFMSVAWLCLGLSVSLTVSRRVFSVRLSLANLREQAQHDGLTGLYNRRSLDLRLSEEWSRHLRSSSSLSAIMLDIDHFKSFNDTLGHQAGDRALRQVAEILADTAQRTTDFVARYGGEEFAILLPSTEVRGAYGIAERIRSRIEAAGIEHPASPSGRLTVSVGVSALVPDAIPADAQNPEVLLAAADRALYEAKRGGRNAVRTAAL